MIELVRQGERVLMTKWQPRAADRVQNFVPEEWVERGCVEGCKAYVSITKGCSNFCTFCVVPYTRGREVSREADAFCAKCAISSAEARRKSGCSART